MENHPNENSDLVTQSQHHRPRRASPISDSENNSETENNSVTETDSETERESDSDSDKLTNSETSEKEIEIENVDPEEW